jgi:hypothetical protein
VSSLFLIDCNCKSAKQLFKFTVSDGSVEYNVEDLIEQIYQQIFDQQIYLRIIKGTMLMNVNIFYFQMLYYIYF